MRRRPRTDRHRARLPRRAHRAPGRRGRGLGPAHLLRRCRRDRGAAGVRRGVHRRDRRPSPEDVSSQPAWPRAVESTPAVAAGQTDAMPSALVVPPEVSRKVDALGDAGHRWVDCAARHHRGPGGGMGPHRPRGAHRRERRAGGLGDDARTVDQPCSSWRCRTVWRATASSTVRSPRSGPARVTATSSCSAPTSSRRVLLLERLGRAIARARPHRRRPDRSHRRDRRPRLGRAPSRRDRPHRCRPGRLPRPLHRRPMASPRRAVLRARDPSGPSLRARSPRRVPARPRRPRPRRRPRHERPGGPSVARSVQAHRSRRHALGARPRPRDRDPRRARRAPPRSDAGRRPCAPGASGSPGSATTSTRRRSGTGHFAERVSTGLFLLELGDDEGHDFLTVAAALLDG